MGYSFDHTSWAIASLEASRELLVPLIETKFIVTRVT